MVFNQVEIGRFCEAESQNIVRTNKLGFIPFQVQHISKIDFVTVWYYGMKVSLYSALHPTQEQV